MFALRRFTQFSLRAFLVGTTMVGFSVGWLSAQRAVTLREEAVVGQLAELVGLLEETRVAKFAVR